MTLISLDTNVIISTLNTADSNHLAALQIFAQLSPATALIISPPTLTELRASAHWPTTKRWMEASQIYTEWHFPPAAWGRAGQAYREYADLRRAGALPRRIAADFLIAAHAEYHSAAILTFDDTVYKAVFPGVELIGATVQ